MRSNFVRDFDRRTTGETGSSPFVGGLVRISIQDVLVPLVLIAVRHEVNCAPRRNSQAAPDLWVNAIATTRRQCCRSAALHGSSTISRW